MLIHPEDLYTFKPGEVFGGLLQDGPNLGPQCVPSRAELPGQALNRRCFVAELTDRPADRTGRQKSPRDADLRVLLNERPHRTYVLVTDPPVFTPLDSHRSPGPGGADHLDYHAAGSGSDDTTARAPVRRITGLHPQYQPFVELRDCDQMKTRQIKEKVAFLQWSSVLEHTQLEWGIVQVLGVSRG